MLDDLKDVLTPRTLISLSTEQVTELQESLKSLGYKVKPDGLFGHQTASAFAEWKLAKYLKDPHLIGPNSLAVLEQDLERLRDRSEIDWSDWDCKISKYFTVGEVTNFSSDRIPKEKRIKSNILRLGKELDVIREKWEKPIFITSWYRPPRINKAVGGVSNSQHINGFAADIKTTTDIFEFQEWLDKNWENALGYGAKKGFVHLDLRPHPIRWNY